MKRRRVFRPRLELESFEDRIVPAGGWADAAHLSLSFAADGTAIAGHSSDLMQTLDAQAARSQWQGEILRAFQTWAVHANINIGVVPDSGDPFGTSGLTQGDARFGDIRIGGQPMTPDVLSVSVPADPLYSGTWVGDVFFNTAAVDSSNLFAVALHEAGHALGLEHSDDPSSVMFSHLNNNTELTQADIEALRAIYGVRGPDRNEVKKDNDSFGNATEIRYSKSFKGDMPLVDFGDISDDRDADFYSLDIFSGYSGPVTFQLHSAGLSLLTPKLTIYDGDGNLLGQAESTNPGDVVTVKLDSVDRKITYFAKVEAATAEVFGIGRYALVTVFDENVTVGQEVIDQVVRGRNDTLRHDEIDALFRNPSLAFAELDFHENDTIGTANRLKTTVGFAENTHFEIVASLDDATDVDYYAIRTPKDPRDATYAVSVTVVGATDNPLLPRLEIFAADGTPAGAEILANGNGTYTVQITDAAANTTFFVRVARPDGVVDTGNYALTARVTADPVPVRTFAEGTLTSTTPTQTYDLFVAQTQLFQFVLSAAGVGSTDAMVHMRITDSFGVEVYSLTTPLGTAASDTALLLTPGAYRVQFTLSGSASDVTYRLRGGDNGEGIGPALGDPTLTPQYTSPDQPGLFLYPEGTTWFEPFLWVLSDPTKDGDTSPTPPPSSPPPPSDGTSPPPGGTAG